MKTTAFRYHFAVLALLIPAIFAGFASMAISAEPEAKDATPLLSTSARWSARMAKATRYPGPTAPFGMIQLSPDTDKVLWETASGYEYSDPTILGFSMTHLSGTGIPDLGDFLFMPQVGKPELNSGKKTPRSRLSVALLARRRIGLGRLLQGQTAKNDVNVELTAGDRAGMMRMTFPESDQASILTDLSHVLSGEAWKVIWSHVRVENEATVTGFHLVHGLGTGALSVFRREVLASVRQLHDHQRRAPGYLQHVSFPQQPRSRRAEPAIPGQLQDEEGRADPGQGRHLGRQRGQRHEESRSRNSRLGLRPRPTRNPGEMGSRTEQDSDRRLAVGQRDALHGHVSLLQHAEPVSRRDGRIPRPGSQYSHGEGLHELRRLFALGHLSRRASAFRVDSGGSRRRHDQLDAGPLRPERRASLPIWALPSNETGA